MGTVLLCPARVLKPAVLWLTNRWGQPWVDRLGPPQQRGLRPGRGQAGLPRKPLEGTLGISASGGLVPVKAPLGPLPASKGPQSSMQGPAPQDPQLKLSSRFKEATGEGGRESVLRLRGWEGDAI